MTNYVGAVKTLLTVLPLFMCVFLSSSCSSGENWLRREDDRGVVVPRPSGRVAQGMLAVKLKNNVSDASVLFTDTMSFEVISVRRMFTGPACFEERKKQYGLDRWYIVSFDPQMQMTRAAGDMLSSGRVETVEYIPEAVLDCMPASDIVFPFDDPKLPEQWHYQNYGDEAQSWLAGSDINLFEAWKITTGNPDVVVAVIDGGIQYNHEDLMDNVWVNEKEASGMAGIDDDGNGYVDDIYGYSFVIGDGDAFKGEIVPQKHGTHVAGTVAAVNNNGIGVSGVAGGDYAAGKPGVRLMSCQISQEGADALIPPAFVYAADNGAVIAQCSWGVDGEMPESLKSAIDYFIDCAGMDENGNQTGPMAGGIAVFAAGNSGATRGYPAMYDRVMAVSAIGADYEAAYYTNYGEWVDICAPGGDVYKNQLVISTVTRGGYDGLQGTSMACPHVSGVAALVVSAYGAPGFTNENLWYTLLAGTKKTVYDHNPAYKGRLGAGMIDAALCLQAYGSEAPYPVENLEVISSTSGSITLCWTVPDDPDGNGEAPVLFKVYCSTSSLPDDGSAMDDGVAVTEFPVSGFEVGDRFTAEIAGLEPDTRYYIRVAALDKIHNCSLLSEQLVCSTTDNTPPYIDPVDGTDIVVKAHETGTLSFLVSDYDGDELEVSLKSGTDALAATLEEGVATVTVNGLNMPGDKRGSKHSAYLVVTDGKSSAESMFTYTVLSNSAPEIKSFPDDILFNGTGMSALLDLSEIFQDKDGENLAYQYSIIGQKDVVDVALSSNELSVYGKKFGQISLAVSASDAVGEVCSVSFKVLVRDASRYADIYPNPVIDTLWMRTPVSVFGASLKIRTSGGGNVMSFDGLSSSPFSPAAVDLSGLKGGMYRAEFSFTDTNGMVRTVSSDIVKL